MFTNYFFFLIMNRLFVSGCGGRGTDMECQIQRQRQKRNLHCQQNKQFHSNRNIFSDCSECFYFCFWCSEFSINDRDKHNINICTISIVLVFVAMYIDYNYSNCIPIYDIWNYIRQENLLVIRRLIF